MKKPDYVWEIRNLRDFIRDLHRQGICPPLAALNHLFQGRAAGYIQAMEKLGHLDISTDQTIFYA